jgi:large subunit ribosomal protein L13
MARALAIASLRVSIPSRRPNVAAEAPLEVANASKPSPASILAEPASHGFGIRADVLRGKNKPIYTPHLDAGDFVVVINAEKVLLTGKKETDKKFMTYSGWKGGEKYTSVAQVRARQPEKLITHAVRGMVPKNRLGRVLMTKLKVYRGSDHPHAAQKPSVLAPAN